MRKLKSLFAAFGLILGVMGALAQSDGGAQQALGYSYLSPLPGAQYCPAQTCFVLVRFAWEPPTAVTNLAQCIQVTGASSGLHPGTTRIASDNQTVIFQTPSAFTPNEIVTVTLTPQVDLTTNTPILPYQYQFMISGAFTNAGTITARGDNPPNATKAMAFDDNLATEWQDLVVPNGTTNFSWIQYVYPGSAMHVVDCYALTSATDNPAGDPASWQLYGVDASSNLFLLDTETNQTFGGRLQARAYTFTNTTAYCGYRLLITRVNNLAAATSVPVDRTGTDSRHRFVALGVLAQHSRHRRQQSYEQRGLPRLSQPQRSTAQFLRAGQLGAELWHAGARIHHGAEHRRLSVLDRQ